MPVRHVGSTRLRVTTDALRSPADRPRARCSRAASSVPPGSTKWVMGGSLPESISSIHGSMVAAAPASESGATLSACRESDGVARSAPSVEEPGLHLAERAISS